MTDSTGRCSTFAEHLSRRLEAERFARPPIQLPRNRVELNPRETLEVHALWHMLSRQAICVRVASMLPWALRIAEIDWDVGGHGELLVSLHPRASALSQ